MTHVFLVFNNLNKKIAEFYALKELSGKKVVFLNLRNSVRKSEWFEDFYSETYDVKLVSYRSGLKKFLSLIYARLFGLREVDKMINGMVSGDRFHVYLPHIYSDLIKAIATHPFCRSISVVEEGDAAYLKNRNYDPSEMKSVLESGSFSIFLSVLMLKKRLGFKGFFPERNIVDKAICLSYDAFCFYNNKYVIDPKAIFSSKINKKQGDKEFVSLVLIDPFVFQGRINFDDYMYAFREFLYFQKSLVSEYKVLISFHPTIRSESEFVNGIKLSFMDNEIIFEEFNGDIESMMASSTKCRVFGLVSSSLRYGKLMGHDVYTWINSFSCLRSPDLKLVYKYNKDIGSFFL